MFVIQNNVNIYFILNAWLNTVIIKDSVRVHYVEDLFILLQLQEANSPENKDKEANAPDKEANVPNKDKPEEANAPENNTENQEEENREDT